MSLYKMYRERTREAKVMIQSMDGALYKALFSGGVAFFEKNVEYINSLNVFPVPDGDTGTNMHLTIVSGRNEISTLTSTDLGVISKQLSRGLLLGARGNSGVILSQIFRGIAQGFEKHKTADTKLFAEGLKKGAEVAYKSVMRPVEGTILTVIRETAKDAVKIARKTDDFESFLEQVLEAAKKSLAKTPDLLPVLKEVGVVDSGGQGLVILFEGMLKALRGEEIDTAVIAGDGDYVPVTLDLSDFGFDDDHEHDAYGFCTEFIIRLHERAQKTYSNEKLQKQLESLDGNSIVIVSDDDIVKVHVHTEHPLQVFEIASTLGEFVTLKSENMQEQFEKQKEHNEPKVQANPQGPKVAVIAVASGSGVANLFKDLGCAYVIEGGQTLNPSTQDFVKAIEEVGAQEVVILPNNSNIILAAQQTKELVDIPLEIIPTRTIPQGLAAMIHFNSESSVEDIATGMNNALENVRSGQVTYAVRDTTMDGLTIKQGDFIGIDEKTIVSADKSLVESTKALLDEMIDEDAEIVTVIAGADTKVKDTKTIYEYLVEKHPDIDIECFDGKQPVYNFLISVE
ncbi:DAK2 domain-containing protein [Culicoidibacter larvae]|uniref:DAK2 domain-containing protein n=2 Tax=Culicoidibacter larvae TaxID=2579976 RepID=A0A5R8QF04_9FIRM|nr:DAK2 domain-containing protein [Culicoidibacter larvae]